VVFRVGRLEGAFTEHLVSVLSDAVSESPRDCRRLQLVRGWRHDEETTTVFAGVS
jgi:hypothetical protein